MTNTKENKLDQMKQDLGDIQLDAKSLEIEIPEDDGKTLGNTLWASTAAAYEALTVEAMAEWVSSARPLPGFNKVYTPGEIEQEIKARLLVDGIDLPDPIWEELGEVAVELGVEIPTV